MKTKRLLLALILSVPFTKSNAYGFEPVLGFGFNYIRQTSLQVNSLRNLPAIQAGFLITSKREDINFSYHVTLNSRKYNYEWPDMGSWKRTENSICHDINFRFRISAGESYLFAQMGTGLLQSKSTSVSEDPDLAEFINSTTKQPMKPMFSMGAGYSIKMGRNHLIIYGNTLTRSQKGVVPALTTFFGAQFALGLSGKKE